MNEKKHFNHYQEAGFVFEKPVDQQSFLTNLTRKFNSSEEKKLNYINPEFDQDRSCFWGKEVKTFYVKIDCDDGKVWAIKIGCQHISSREYKPEYEVFKTNVERVVRNILEEMTIS